MRIQVNGEDREISQEFSLQSLLTELQLNPLQVAVEVNMQLVPRDDHAEYILREGDTLEIVTLVGGG